MRLLIVGTMDGHIKTAGRIALSCGAKVAHAETIDAAMTALRAGQGADLLMVEVKLNVAALCESLKNERFSIPVVACGIGRRGPRHPRRCPRVHSRCRPMPN